MSKPQLKRSDVVKVDPWEGTLWKVRVRIDGRHVLPYMGPGIPRADALKLARTMAHPAYIAKVWDPPAQEQA